MKIDANKVDRAKAQKSHQLISDMIKKTFQENPEIKDYYEKKGGYLTQFFSGEACAAKIAKIWKNRN